MRIRHALTVVGALAFCTGLTMLFPLGFSLYYADAGQVPLLEAMLLATSLGAGFYLVFRQPGRPLVLNHREGMAIVALGWFVAGIFGGLPFLFGGVFETWTDCFFESFSGFTTTGASVLTDIEAVPRGLLMWRSLTHWLGGMGIIVLSLAILPFLGVGGMQLYKAEVPGPTPDKLTPRIKDTAMVLWKVYVLFTVMQTLLLMACGMDFFDSVAHTFGAMATGGFSTKNASIAHYDSYAVHGVITLFMFLAGVNFSLHFRLLQGRPGPLLKDPEFRFYAFVTVLFTALTAVAVVGPNYEGFGQALNFAAFQVVSICTTTGYATADYELWPALPQALLLFLMFMGGCAGSTGGGMKVMRILLILKHSYVELIRLIHPRTVRHIKLGGRIVPPEVMSAIWGFFFIYILVFVVSSFALAALGMDVVSSFAAVAASIGNIGPGIGTVGPTDNYAHIPELGKWVLIVCMLLGRLEIYTVIILFVPEFWRK